MTLIEDKIKITLNELGFTKVDINNVEMYTNGKKYLKLTFLNDLKSYVIEYAENIDDAKKNRFEDGDAFSVTTAEEELIREIREEIICSLG